MWHGQFKMLNSARTKTRSLGQHFIVGLFFCLFISSLYHIQ